MRPIKRRSARRGPLTTSAFQKEALKTLLLNGTTEEVGPAGNKVTGIGIGQGYPSAGTNIDGLLAHADGNSISIPE